jgi:predicted RNA binding protein YcfA (HicA-like mRNA interferase family)
MTHESDALIRILRRRATRLDLRHEEIEAKGSHLKLRHGPAQTVIPMHRGDLPSGTFRAILKQLGLTEDDLGD